MADQLYGIEVNLGRSSNPKIYFLLERPETGSRGQNLSSRTTIYG